MQPSICCIANYRDKGGISTAITLMYRHLRNEAIATRIITTHGPLLLRPFRILSIPFRIRKYDVLHVHGCCWLGFIPLFFGIRFGKFFRKKIVATYHGGDFERFISSNRLVAWIIRSTLKKADILTVPSMFLKKQLAEYGIESRVIPNLIDEKFFTDHDWNPSVHRFLYVKYLEQRYGIDTLLRAFSLIKKSVPDAQLVIVGRGPQKEELQQLARELDIYDAVTFKGNVEYNDIQNEYFTASYFLSTSRIDSFSIVIIEASAAGLPIVTTGVGGIMDIIKNGYNGLVVKDCEDYRSIAQKAIQIVNDPSLARQLRDNARSHAQKYHWNTIRKKWFDAFGIE